LRARLDALLFSSVKVLGMKGVYATLEAVLNNAVVHPVLCAKSIMCVHVQSIIVVAVNTNGPGRAGPSGQMKCQGHMSDDMARRETAARQVTRENHSLERFASLNIVNVVHQFPLEVVRQVLNGIHLESNKGFQLD
jgi:hypothetical protein